MEVGLGSLTFLWQAEGRDTEESDLSVPWRPSRDIFVPCVHDGILQYTLMEMVESGEVGKYWTLRAKMAQPPVPLIATTRDTPNAVTSTAGMAMMRY
jgi:hypothetical protein